MCCVYVCIYVYIFACAYIFVSFLWHHRDFLGALRVVLGCHGSLGFVPTCGVCAGSGVRRCWSIRGTCRMLGCHEIEYTQHFSAICQNGLNKEHNSVVFLWFFLWLAYSPRSMSTESPFLSLTHCKSFLSLYSDFRDTDKLTVKCVFYDWTAYHRLY